jgi:hypothetical protein
LKLRMYRRAVRPSALRPSRALRWGVARPRAHSPARSPARLQARAAYSPSFLPTDRAELSARHLIACHCLSLPLAACSDTCLPTYLATCLLAYLRACLPICPANDLPTDLLC